MGLGCVETCSGRAPADTCLAQGRQRAFPRLFYSFSVRAPPLRSCWVVICVLGPAAVRAMRSRLSLYRCHQRPDAHDVQDTREIVGKHVQRHFASDVRQPLH
jgi:hypothetical protein